MIVNEESVFAEALHKADPQERTRFLDQACAGNAALRAGVESLLAAHAQGSFLEAPAVPRPGEEQADRKPSGVTEAHAASSEDESGGLEFLTPSEQPGSLGRL